MKHNSSCCPQQSFSVYFAHFIYLTINLIPVQETCKNHKQKTDKDKQCHIFPHFVIYKIDRNDAKGPLFFWEHRNDKNAQCRAR